MSETVVIDEERQEVLGHLKYACKGTPSEAGIRAAILLHRWQGLHHFPSKDLKKVDWENDRYQVIQLDKHNMGGSNLSSYDFNDLTRLVFLAHDLAIRVHLSPRNFSYLELMLHARSRPGESMSTRHPTIEEALTTFRAVYPAVPHA